MKIRICFIAKLVHPHQGNETAVSWRMNLLSLIFTVLATLASTENAKAGSGKWVHAGSNITLQYDGEENGRYRNLSVMKQGELVRCIALSKRSYSLFEYDPDPTTSPDGRYVLVTDVESGEVGLTDGRGSLHERQYCGFIDTRSGCLLARQTGQFCGGQFNDAGAWVSPALPDLHPSEVRPTAEDYASARLSPSDAPDGSLDNLLRCDPPGPGNRDHYGKLIEAGIFDVTPSQRRALYGG
ncbi:hypothetical protein [Stenotrophomonas maltophilia]|uniref:hypothetical protein n=1 Tax=Stenotrophomonas maltophilia TaxID=40324 RepID=UPI0021C8BECF|nr:hypothetical protein [Stenotrophomonas maltophilia]MCU1134723.1 hypothetical protein [Stenotrophomonas maltophilia]